MKRDWVLYLGGPRPDDKDNSPSLSQALDTTLLGGLNLALYLFDLPHPCDDFRFMCAEV